MSEDGTININEVKSGMRVRFKDGHEAIVRDNKKGMIRTVEVPLFGGGGTETGSCYAYEWKSVEVNDTWIIVSMTVAQQKNADRIQGFRSVFG